MRSARHVLATSTTVLVLVLAGVGLWQAGQERPRTVEQRTEQIAAGLGCPTCQAQSVAMSHSEIAAAMRAEIRAQLVAGRSPEQIRAWFADRYGPAVLLAPPRSGVGLVLWVVPALLFGAGLLLIAAVLRRSTTSGGTPRAPGPQRRILSASVPVRLVAPAAALTLAAAGVGGWLVLRPAGPPDPAAAAATVPPSDEVARAERAVTDRPTDPEAWVALGVALETERSYERSAQAYRIAAQLRPQDVRAKVRLGLVLLQTGAPEEAASVARQILSAHPEHPEGVLVLGLAQRARDLPEARDTLQRFLDLAPAHPAAGEVRRLIRGRESGGP